MMMYAGEIDHQNAIDRVTLVFIDPHQFIRKPSAWRTVPQPFSRLSDWLVAIFIAETCCQEAFCPLSAYLFIVMSVVFQ